VRIGELTRVAEGVYLLPTAYDDAFRRLATLPQPFTVSQARQVLGTSRRVAVPLLEALDAAGRTRRVDNAHREVIARSANPGTHSAEKSGGGSGEATA
jgi:selenocysteine-specific elongation factor